LTWPETEHATHYDILIAEQPDLSRIVVTVLNLTEPWFCLDDPSNPRIKASFKPYRCYYWNLMTHNRFGEAWYPVFGFATATEGEATSELGHPLPVVNYQMISIPLHPDNPDPAVVLGKTLGPYDPSQWRLFWYASDKGIYHEYPQVPHVSPGIAYWLIVAESATLKAQGFPTAVDRDYIITIPPRFFQLGCPFPFPVKWRDVKVGKEGISTSVADMGNDWMSPALWKFKDGSYFAVDVLEPWEGYWVENLTNEPLELSIPPRMAVPDSP